MAAVPDEDAAARNVSVPSDDETCADCGWLGPWREMYRVKYPNDRRPEPRVQGFYLCVNCWDRLCGAAVLEAIR